MNLYRWVQVNGQGSRQVIKGQRSRSRSVDEGCGMKKGHKLVSMLVYKQLLTEVKSEDQIWLKATTFKPDDAGSRSDGGCGSMSDGDSGSRSDGGCGSSDGVPRRLTDHYQPPRLHQPRYSLYSVINQPWRCEHYWRWSFSASLTNVHLTMTASLGQDWSTAGQLRNILSPWVTWPVIIQPWRSIDVLRSSWFTDLWSTVSSVTSCSTDQWSINRDGFTSLSILSAGTWIVPDEFVSNTGELSLLHENVVTRVTMSFLSLHSMIMHSRIVSSPGYLARVKGVKISTTCLR